MTGEFDKLKQIQQLVIDITKIERNHYMPGTNRRENVVEHSFSLAMLCWRIFEIVKPPLDIAKILKYALVHDFMERGMANDVNTYATETERQMKKELEAQELKKLSLEGGFFIGEDTARNLHLLKGDLWGLRGEMEWHVLSWLDIISSYEYGRQVLTGLAGNSHQATLLFSGHWF